MARPELADLSLCPCGCGGVSLKGLTKRGHVPGCGTPRSGATKPCSSCQGSRNKRKGQRAQARAHRALGGEGFTPSNEESARPYLIEVCVMPEVKTGEQVPRSFEKLIASEWFRHALSQSARAAPVGSGARPAVVIRGDWCIIDLRRPR